MNNDKLAIGILQDMLDSNLYTNLTNIAFNVAIKSLEKQSNDKWILVNERLPKEGIAVLVSDKQGNVCVRAITCEIKGRKYWSQDKYDVLAWQPLPEEYREVENE